MKDVLDRWASALIVLLALSSGCVAASPDAASGEYLRDEATFSPGTIRFPEEPEVNRCCVCYYDPNPACDGIEDLAECFTAHPDCRWVAGIEACEDRHKQECRDWLEAPEQDDCADKQLLPRGEIPDFPVDCTEISVDDDGHYCGLVEHSKGILVCLQTGCDVDYTMEGCREFVNMALVLEWVQILGPALPPGQTLTVSGNQCTSQDGCQLGKCTITLTCDGAHFEWPRCDGLCVDFAEGETQMCMDVNDRTIKRQICCGQDDGGFKFQDGPCTDVGGEDVERVPAKRR